MGEAGSCVSHLPLKGEGPLHLSGGQERGRPSAIVREGGQIRPVSQESGGSSSQQSVTQPNVGACEEARRFHRAHVAQVPA